MGYHYALIQAYHMVEGKLSYQDVVRFHHPHKMYIKGVWDALCEVQEASSGSGDRPDDWDLAIVRVDPEDGSCEPVVFIKDLLDKHGYTDPLDFLRQHPERKATFYISEMTGQNHE